MANSTKMRLDSRILVTGASGLVGKALIDLLESSGYQNVVGLESRDAELTDARATREIFDAIRPEYVFHLAARVYGLGGNLKYMSEILVDNCRINLNVVESATKCGATKILGMGSGCVYPELDSPSGLREEQIWEGPPHFSEAAYAHSKRIMLAHLEAASQQEGLDFAFVISANLYGEFDNFNVTTGHVIPSLIAKFFKASINGDPVLVWGSGMAVRDFCHSTDAAAALLLIMDFISGPVNLGSGRRASVAEIVSVLSEHTGLQAEWDAQQPNGQLSRYYDLGRLAEVGYSARISLTEGLIGVYDWYAQNYSNVRGSQ